MQLFDFLQPGKSIKFDVITFNGKAKNMLNTRTRNSTNVESS